MNLQIRRISSSTPTTSRYSVTSAGKPTLSSPGTPATPASNLVARKQTTIYIDPEKWNEICRRSPNMSLTSFIDRYLTRVLALMIEERVDLDTLYDQAASETLAELEEDV